MTKDKKDFALQALFAISQELPEIMVNKEVKRIMNMPLDKVGKEIERITKKGKKITMGDFLVVKKVLEMLNIENK